MATKKQACWPGYEKVPGKAQGTKGSCRKKAASKSTPSEKEFQEKRQKQLDDWQRKHPGSPRSAAQHLSAPTKKTAAAKKRAPKKSGK